MKTIVRNTLNHKAIEHQFSGLAEFAAYGQTPCDMPDSERQSLQASFGHDWDYGVDYAGAMELVRGGWPEGARKMRETADKMYEKIAPRVPVFGNTEHAVSGAAVDIAAYVEGIPECMLEFMESRVEAPKPVDIMVSIAAAANVTADEVCNKGAAILAAVDVLNNRGCAVTIGIDVTTTNDERAAMRYTLTYSAPLHSPGEVLDIDALAFVLLHPAMLRRIAFAAREHAPEVFRKKIGITGAGDYGQSMNHPATPPETLYFPRLREDNKYDYSTPEKAVETVLSILKQHGLTIEDER